MNGTYTPMPDTGLLLRTYSGTYSAEANGVAEITLSYSGGDATEYVNNDWRPIGITYFTTASSGMCVCEVSNISLTGARMVIKNTTSSAVSNRTAYVTAMFARATRVI